MYIRLLPPEAVERENRWWSTLSDEEKRAEIDRRNKEDDMRDAWKGAIAILVFLSLIIYPMAMVFWHMMGWRP